MAGPEPTLRDRLNREFRHLRGCIWPGCTQRTWPLLRVGPICAEHADQVSRALAEILIDGSPESFDRLARAQDRGRRWNREQDQVDHRRGKQPGWVYYLAIADRLKIGYSTDVRRRMAQYPPGAELLAVEPGSKQLEAERHRQFAGLLLDGREWFRRATVLDEHIARLVQAHGDAHQFRHRFRSSRGRMHGVDRS